MRYFKFFFLIFFALLPITSKMRFFLYKILYGKNIIKSKVGFLSIVDVNNINLFKAEIKPFVFIFNVKELVMKENTKIKSFTIIKNLDKFLIDKNSLVNKNCRISGPGGLAKLNESQLLIGKEVVINKSSFDLCDNITIGNNVVFAGIGTQLWTHSFDLNRNRIQAPIFIGNNVYIGSRSIINLGVNIVDNVVIHAGSVINKSIKNSGVWGTNQLIKMGEVHNYNEYLKGKTNFELIKKISDVSFFRKNISGGLEDAKQQNDTNNGWNG